jgi:hypothetical protein
MVSSERTKLAVIHTGFLVFIFVYAVYQVVQWRNISHSIDLVSYLDIGDAYWRGDFQHAVNHYWSPMYSWILGGVIAVFRPGIDHEMLAVRLTNLFLVSAFVGSFVYFAKTFQRHLSAFELRWLSAPAYWFYMYCLVAFSALVLGGCDKDTPDMLVASFIILASTAFLKVRMNERRGLNLLFMGAMLGCGYLAKAVVLPISLFYYIAAWWEMRNERSVWKQLAPAAIVQLGIVVPFIAAITMTFGHLTISDTTRTLALYSNSQNDQQVHFQFPELKHKSRLIFEKPDVYEFDGSVIGGTYPPWNNPAYWTEGAPSGDPLARGAGFAIKNLKFFAVEIFSFILAGWLIASIYLRRSCITFAGIISALPLVAPSLVAVGIYAITANLWGHFMERYFVAWFALLYSGAILFARFPDTTNGARAGRLYLGSMAILMISIVVAFIMMHRKMLDLFPTPDDATVAHAIQNAGLKPGDKIAQLGFRRYYWARLARLKIVADIFDIDGFWNMAADRREQLIEVLRKNNVKAIVMTWAHKEVKNPGPGWITVPSTNALIYIIPPREKLLHNQITKNGSANLQE